MFAVLLPLFRRVLRHLQGKRTQHRDLMLACTGHVNGGLIQSFDLERQYHCSIIVIIYER